jgi:hemerythrin-like domain-containing protein
LPGDDEAPEALACLACLELAVKRSEALQPLSRDHHQALKAAIGLKRASETEEAGRSFLKFWDGHGQEHFRIEEEVLLPLWAEHGPHDDPAVARVLTDHVAIRRDALRLRRGELGVDGLHALGEMLDRHVRFEERELFPLIERTLDEEAQAELTAAVLAAESGS